MTFDDLMLYAPFTLGLMMVGYGLCNLIMAQFSSGSGRVRRRLRQAGQAGRPGAHAQSIAKAMLSRASRAGRGIPMRGLERALNRAGITASPSLILTLTGLAMGVIFIGVSLVFTALPKPMTVLLSAVLSGGGLLAWVSSKKRQRLAQIEEHLPDALDLIVRALRIGLPLSATLELVAKEIPGPISEEFQLTFEEVNYGKSLTDALNDMCDRAPVADLRYFAVAVNIQNESGGNLSEILTGLAKTIRERFRLFRKVKSITAEGRMSAWFLTVFPLFLAGFIQLIKPDYYTQVADSAAFIPCIVIVVLLLIINFVAMKLFTAIKV